MMRRPDRGTEATMAPFLRQIEQLHRSGSTIPLGRVSSNTTAPQWQDARCFGEISVAPTCLITALTSIVLHGHFWTAFSPRIVSSAGIRGPDVPRHQR